MHKKGWIPEQGPDETAIGRRSHRPNLGDDFFFDRRQAPCGPALHRSLLQIEGLRGSEQESGEVAFASAFRSYRREVHCSQVYEVTVN